MKCTSRKLTVVLFLCLGIPSLSHTQSSGARIPHRIINAQEINTAGDDRFKLVLHYLMPDLFPKTEQGWVKTLREISVHRPENPHHEEFLKVLEDPALQDPAVDMGNLAEFLPAQRQTPQPRRRRYSLVSKPRS